MSSTDRRTDGRTDKVNAVYPPSNFVVGGYNYKVTHVFFQVSVAITDCIIFGYQTMSFKIADPRRLEK